MIFLSQRRLVRSQKRLILLALLVIAFSSGPSLMGKVHRTSKRDLKREVETLEEQWRTAQINGDLVAMDRLLSDDFVGISMAGQANNKEQQLSRFRERRLVLSQINLSDSKVKLVGSIAIVTSLAEVEGMNEGTSMKGMYRYTRIYQLLPSGVWKTTNFEATRIPSDRRQPPPSR